jgi:hypothetical protein
MSLTRDQVSRWGGMAGILFVVIGMVALFLPGTPPKADEVSKITSYFADKRGSILAANYMAGLAFAFFLFFVGALRAHLGAADAEGVRPGSAALAGGVMATAMIIAGNAVINGAVFQVAAAGDTNVNHALYDVASDLFVSSGFGFAVFFGGAAVAIAATGALPSFLAPAGLVAAVLNAIAPVALFAKTGFFAIGGAFGFVAPLASVLWVLAASIFMLRQAPTARPGAPQSPG